MDEPDPADPHEVVFIGPSLLRTVLMPYVFPWLLGITSAFFFVRGEPTTASIFVGLLVLDLVVARGAANMRAKVTSDEVIVGDWHGIYYIPIGVAAVELQERSNLVNAWIPKLEDDNTIYTTRSIVVLRDDDPDFEVVVPNAKGWSRGKIVHVASDFQAAIEASAGRNRGAA